MINLENDLNDYKYMDQKYLLSIQQAANHQNDAFILEINLFFEVTAAAIDEITLKVGLDSHFNVNVSEPVRSSNVPGMSSSIALDDNKVYVNDVKGVTLSFYLMFMIKQFLKLNAHLR